MVRSEDDLLVLDRCAGPLEYKLYLNGELTPGTHVFQFADGEFHRVFSSCFPYSSLSSSF